MPRLSLPKPYLCAIDPSISGMAVAIGRLHCKPSEVVMNRYAAGAVDRQVGGRITRWNEHVQKVVYLLREYEPTLVMLEGYSFGSRGQATLDLAELGGLLRNALLERWHLVEVSPKTLKKFITGNGNANKLEMVAALSKEYGVSYKTDDEYDAFGLHLMAQAYVDESLMKRMSQRECMAKLKTIII